MDQDLMDLINSSVPQGTRPLLHVVDKSAMNPSGTLLEDSRAAVITRRLQDGVNVFKQENLAGDVLQFDEGFGGYVNSGEMKSLAEQRDQS